VIATPSTDWNTNRNAAAVAVALTSDFEEIHMRKTLVAVRDTVIVFGMQVVFRATMLLRHFNY
jgi:hypothetical protein